MTRLRIIAEYDFANRDPALERTIRENFDKAASRHMSVRGVGNIPGTLTYLATEQVKGVVPGTPDIASDISSGDFVSVGRIRTEFEP